MKRKKKEPVLEKLLRLMRNLRRMTRNQMITAREADRILRNAVDYAFRKGAGNDGR